jgi:hypothetical protein
MRTQDFSHGKRNSDSFKQVQQAVAVSNEFQDMCAAAAMRAQPLSSSVRLQRPWGYRAGRSLSVGHVVAALVDCLPLTITHSHCLCAVAGPLADQVGSATGSAWGSKSRRLMPSCFRLVVPGPKSATVTVSLPVFSPVRQAGTLTG